MSRCGFGLCQRPAERRVVTADLVDAGRVAQVMHVCSLHVNPVLSWGRAEPMPPTSVEFLAAAG